MNTRTLALALAAATLVAYAPVLSASFINYDDLDYVVKNPVVPDGLTMRGLRWSLTATHMWNWHPLTWISHMADVALFGLNPTGHHLTSVLLHVANALLLATFLVQATGSTGRSLAVAMLFALHPLHVESVAWVSERKDLICTLFWILALIQYVRWTRSASRLAYVGAVFFFVLALASKPMAVTLPFVFLLFDVWPIGRLRVFGIGGLPARADPPPRPSIGLGRAFMEKIPFFVLSVASSIVTYVVQRESGAIDVIERMSTPYNLSDSWYNLSNAVVTYARYIGKMLVPAGLAIIYPHPRGGWPLAVVLLAAVGLVLTTIVVVKAGRDRPWLPVGWFFYLGVLVPTIGVIPVGAQSMADRYTYIPLVGLFIVVVWTVADMVSGIRRSIVVLGATAGGVALACGALTFRQAGYFNDGVTIFRHAVAVTAPNAVASTQLGSALLKEHRLEEAEQAFRTAIAIAPEDARAHTYLGALLANLHKTNEAMREYETALALQPESAIAHYYFGLALRSRHESKRALDHFLRAVAIAPSSYAPHAGLGFGLSDDNQLDLAIAEFETAIRLNPHGSTDARDGLGVALVRSGRLKEALAIFREALAMDPSRGVAHANLGNSLVDSGSVDEGILHLEIAAQLEPQNALTRYALANALFTRGRVREAVVHYRESARIDPSNKEVQRELAAALQMLGAPAP